MGDHGRTSPLLVSLIWLLVPMTVVLILAAVDPTGLRLAGRTLIEVIEAMPFPSGSTTGVTRPAGTDPASNGLSEILAVSPVVLQGRFEPRDATTRSQTGAVTLTHAFIRTERGGLAARTAPVRIIEGKGHLDRGHTFAARFGLGQGEQIELRRIRPAIDGGHEVSASPLCQGRKPELVALWPGRGRMVMIVWPEGAEPGPEAERDAPCGIWSYRR